MIGESAGGHLVSITGTTGNDPSVEGLHLGSAGVSSRVQAVVDLFGPTDFLQMDGHEGIGCSSANHNAANSPESILLGCALPTCPERVESANPMHYLDADDPQFFVSCGDHDCLVAPYSSLLFDAALTEKNVTHTYELIAGQGHGGSFWHNTAQDAKYLEFFNTALASGCNPTAIKERNLKKSKVSIFPNPASDSFTLELPANEYFDVNMKDLTGRNVYQGQQLSGSIIISISELPNGLYLIEALGGNHVLNGKILKN